MPAPIRPRPMKPTIIGPNMRPPPVRSTHQRSWFLSGSRGRMLGLAMVSTKDLARHLKTASWQSPTEIEAFVKDVGVLPGAELAKLLPLLLDKALVAEPRTHKTRCQVFAKLAEKVVDRELFVPYV